MDIPDDIAQELLQAVGAYVRATPATELPPALGPVKKTVQTTKGLGRHRARLLGLLEDDVMRKRMGEWLEDFKPSLTKRQRDALRIACDRPEGWIGQLEGMSTLEDSDAPDEAPDTAGLERKLERLRLGEKRAREAERKARDEAKAAIESYKRDAQEARDEVDALRARVSELEKQLAAALKDVERAERDADRDRRKVRSLEEKAEVERDKLRAQLKEARAEARSLTQRVHRLEARSQKAGKERPAPDATKGAPPTKPKKRPALAPPKGRFDDAPQTLDEWLGRSDVTLLVDGYNVTRHEAGFAHLSLEKQRERLLDLLKKLSARYGVDTYLVWDGGEVPPATTRKKHGRVRVEFSAPAKTAEEKDRADRHILALLEKLPPDPVIVVTNDKELRESASGRGATLATSQQLLAVAR